MKKAFAIRNEVESALHQRIPGALSPRPSLPPERLTCGIEAVDSLLGGGVPLGSITELVGPNGSGRTSIALGFLATITHAEKICAWVDAADSFDPESAAANGVDLERLLWVRCGAVVESSLPGPIAKPAISVARPFPKTQPRHTGGGSPHPRLEDRDMPAAVRVMMQAHGGMYDEQANRDRRVRDAKIGTPGAPNR